MARTKKRAAKESSARKSHGLLSYFFGATKKRKATKKTAKKKTSRKKATKRSRGW